MTRAFAFLALIALLAAACADRPTTSPSLAPSPTPAASPTAPVAATPTFNPTPSPPPSWAQISSTGDTPAPREDHTWTVDAATGTAWLFGGRDRGTLFDDLWSFDLATDQWTRVEPSGDAPAARFGHTGTWVDGVGLVVWSGQAGGDFFADLHAYDPASNRWARLPDAGAVPEARYGSCAAVGPDRRLWISHGFTHAGRFADTRTYDFDTKAWAEVTPAEAGPVKRCLHDCLWSPTELVLYAGQTDGVAALGDLWTLFPGGGWTEVEVTGPPARQLYALAASETTGWVLGGRGVDGKFLDDLWTLDLDTLTWRPVALSGDAPAGRAGATLIADPASSRLVLFGGVGTGGASAEVWELSPAPS